MNLIKVFDNRVFNRRLLFLAFPIALQNLMLALVAAADALMLGKVSQNAMAAVSLATQIQFIQNVLLAGITGGIGILGAQYWGKKDCGTIQKIFGLSVRESLLISMFFFAGCRFLPEKLMLIFAHDPDLIRLGSEYLKIAGWSYLLTGASVCYLAIMRVSNHASRSAWISSGAVVLNIVLNFVFIFGFLGIPAMGIKGAALATVLSRIIELAWCVISTYERSFIRLTRRAVFTFDALLFRDFWRYALPVMGSALLWGVGFAAYTAVIGHLGADAAAANAVAAVVRDIMCCLCSGVAFGAGILIGNELGAGRLVRAREYGNRTMLLSLLIGPLSSAAILASIPVAAYSLDLTATAHRYMVGMFVILSVYMIGRCICTVLINGIFASGGDTIFDLYTLIVCMWGIALPCAFAGAFLLNFPVLLVYACTCLDEVGKVPWVMIHYRKYRWLKNITRR